MKEAAAPAFFQIDFGSGSGAQVHFHKEKSSEMRKNLISVLKIYVGPVFLIKLVPYSKRWENITSVL